MKTRFNIAVKAGALALAAVLAAAPAAPLRAQSPSRDSWDSLRQIDPGQQVQVVLMNAQSHRGKFVSYNDQALSLTSKDSGVTLNRDQVLRVSMLDGAKRKRNTLLGLGIGAAAGLAGGGLLYKRLNNDGATQEATNLLLGITGGAAAAGAAMGRTGGFRVVYRAPAKTQKQ
jgi:hypothetical protein